MNIILKNILIFNKKWEKRWVSFDIGLNIITWYSKTWKSALLKIIDYCLFSEESNIPHWKIKDFAFLYAVVFQVNDEMIVVWREENDKNNTYILKVRNIEDVAMSSFDKENKKTTTDAGKLLLKYFGINTSQNNELTIKEWGVSIRNMLPLITQPQFTIASEKELFNWFENNFKKIATKEDFLFFIKLVNNDYLRIKRQLGKVNSKIRNLKLQDKTNVELLGEMKEELLSKIQEFLLNINHKYDALDESLIELDFDLIFDTNFGSGLLAEWFKSTELTKLKEQRKETISQIQEINNKLLIFNGSINEIDKYYNNTKQTNELLKELIRVDDPYNSVKCPLCFHSVNQLQEESESIRNLNSYFQEELEQLVQLNFNISDKEISLIEKKKDLQKTVYNLNEKIDYLEKANNDTTKTIYERLLILKTEINLEKRYLLRLIDNIEDTDTEHSLLEQQKTLQNSLEEIDISKWEYSEYLNTKIDEICWKLDIEEKYKGYTLKFNFDDFKLFYEKWEERIYSNQIWSWANQLALHLSLFLWIMWLSVKTNSYLPKFLFIDQPSQVYFPELLPDNIPDKSEYIKDEDTKKVASFFTVILDELAMMKKDTWIMPQIIITDHVNNLKLNNDYQFQDYVRKNWRWTALI